MPEKADESKSLSDEKFKHSSSVGDENSKDKRKRKDKIKPLTKVELRLLLYFIFDNIVSKIFHFSGDYSSVTTNHDRR